MVIFAGCREEPSERCWICKKKIYGSAQLRSIPVSPELEKEFIEAFLYSCFDNYIAKGEPLVIEQMGSIEEITWSHTNFGVYANMMIHRVGHYKVYKVDRAGRDDVPLAQAVEDFCAKNRFPVDISTICSNSINPIIMSNSEFTNLFERSPGDGWMRFYQKYPKSPGIITLSRPGFSADGSTAVILLGHQWEGLAGYGQLYIYRKINNKWEEDSLYISIFGDQSWVS